MTRSELLEIMTKVNSLADLKKMRDDLQSKIKIRGTGDHAESMVQVKVAMATCGIASGAKEIMDFMIDELDKQSINSVVTQTGCMGYCYAEPTIEVTLPDSEPIVFGYVDNNRATEIIEKYIKKGEIVEGVLPVNYETID